MIAPERGQPNAERRREDFREGNVWRRKIGRVVFAATAVAMAYLTLMPNYGYTRFQIVPSPLYRWLADPEQDWFVNIVAFGFLAVVVFIVWGKSRGRGALLATLLALVCAIEIAQIWIPGRTSSLEDVCFGWSGIFAAWFLVVLRDARVENGGAK